MYYFRYRLISKWVVFLVGRQSKQENEHNTSWLPPPFQTGEMLSLFRFQSAVTHLLVSSVLVVAENRGVMNVIDLKVTTATICECYRPHGNHVNHSDPYRPLGYHDKQCYRPQGNHGNWGYLHHSYILTNVNATRNKIFVILFQANKNLVSAVKLAPALLTLLQRIKV